MAAVSSHLFAAGDIDYINNLNLVRTDVSGLVTEANAKGTMSTQNANAVAITGGSAYGLTSVGVGTATPDARLHVGGDGPVASFCGTTGASFFLLGNKDSVGSVGPRVIWSANRSLNFGRGTSFTGTGGTLTTDLTISDTGNVGIGTASPVFQFHVQKTGAGDCNAIFKADTDGAEIYVDGKTSYASYRTRINGVNKWGIGHIGSASDFYIYDYTSFLVRFAVTASGNVLVGTTTDNGTDKLQVNGGVSSAGRVVSTSPTAGVGYATGAGGSVTQTGTLVSSVTLNKMSGVITTVSGGLGVNTRIKFLVSNSGVSATDVVHVTNTGSGTAGVDDNVAVHCCQVVSGGFYIEMWNRGTASTAAGTWVFNFAVIKAVTS